MHIDITFWYKFLPSQSRDEIFALFTSNIDGAIFVPFPKYLESGR